MVQRPLVALLLSVTSVLGSPITILENELLQRDDQCDFDAMQPDISNYNCDRKFKLDKNGDCEENSYKIENDCLGYCEIRTYKKYGKEVYVGQRCRELECQITVGWSLSNTTGYSISADIGGSVGPEKAIGTFSLGASYQYSETVQKTFTQAMTKKVSEDQKKEGLDCGHFAFIPELLVSCGTLSKSGKKDQATYTPYATDNRKVCNPLHIEKSIPNWCTVTAVENPSEQGGGTKGTTIFVHENCKTNQPLLDGQDPIYYHEGVSRTNGYKGNPATALDNVAIPVKP